MRRKATEGFALTELLVVASIVGILATIALPHLWERQTRAKQVTTMQTLRFLANYEMMVFNRCKELTTSAYGITRSGCDAGVLWTPPPECGKSPQQWAGPPFFPQKKLDPNNYGYQIFFPGNETNPGQVPVIARAIKNLDNSPNKDIMVATPNASIYHISDDLIDVTFSSLEGVFQPVRRRAFNFCAVPELDNPASDPPTNPQWF